MNLTKAVEVFSERFGAYPGFWCVAGGWALDLYLNQQTRQHEDLDVVVLRSDYDILYRHLKSLHPRKVIIGNPPAFVCWNGDSFDSEVIQLQLRHVNNYQLDLLLTPSSIDEWRCIMDESITRSLTNVAIMTPSGIPVLAPEIVLLFKARTFREKDIEDYSKFSGSLPLDSLGWLRKTLKKIEPEHPWTRDQL